MKKKLSLVMIALMAIAAFATTMSLTMTNRTIGEAQDEVSPEGGTSNAQVNGTSFWINGTTNAGSGTKISPMSGKGIKVRKSTPLVMTVNEGYRINSVTAYAASNDASKSFQITKIEVDGVEYVPDGTTMPISCALKEAGEATTIAITGIAATQNITFTFGGDNSQGIMEFHVNYTQTAAVTQEITAVKLNGAAIGDEDLATLKSAKSLTIDGSALNGIGALDVTLSSGATTVSRSISEGNAVYTFSTNSGADEYTVTVTGVVKAYTAAGSVVSYVAEALSNDSKTLTVDNIAFNYTSKTFGYANNTDGVTMGETTYKPIKLSTGEGVSVTFPDGKKATKIIVYGWSQDGTGYMKTFKDGAAGENSIDTNGNKFYATDATGSIYPSVYEYNVENWEALYFECAGGQPFVVIDFVFAGETAADTLPIELTFATYNDKSVNNYTSTWTATKDGKVWTFDGFNNNQNGWESVKCGRKSDAQTATITSPAVNAVVTNVVYYVVNTKNIESVKFSIFNGETQVGTDQDITAQWAKGEVNIPVENAQAGYSYKLTISSTTGTNGSTEIKEIGLYGEGQKPVVHIANDIEHPYTVAKAIEIIDAGMALTETVFVQGIISQIDDKFNETNGTNQYWISDDGTTTNQMEVYSGLGLNGAKFTSKDDIALGATVIVTGTLTKYNTIYEFNANNQLANYIAPDPIKSVALEGAKGNIWDAEHQFKLDLVKGEGRVYTGVLDLTGDKTDCAINLTVNGNWLHMNTAVDAPKDWGYWWDETAHDANCMTLYNSITGYKTYTITATWVENDDVTKQWTVKVEGNEPSYEVPAGAIWYGRLNDWAEGIAIDKSKFANLKAGDLVKVTFLDYFNTDKENEWGAQLQLFCGNGKVFDMGVGKETASTTGSFTVTGNLKNQILENGLTIAGKMCAAYITIEAGAEPIAESSVWAGEQTLTYTDESNWGWGTVETPFTELGATVGAGYTITIKCHEPAAEARRANRALEDGDLTICLWDATANEGTGKWEGDNTIAVKAIEGGYQFAVNAEQAAKINGKGFGISSSTTLPPLLPPVRILRTSMAVMPPVRYSTFGRIAVRQIASAMTIRAILGQKVVFFLRCAMYGVVVTVSTVT